MIDYKSIICTYYTPGSKLYELLIKHSEQVARKAIDIASHSSVCVDIDFVYEAAMLHDIGIFKTHAPSIYCEGEAKYICHGIIGCEILDIAGFPKHGLVCERHTGAGISLQDIKSKNFPLPHREMLPISNEEKLICYADKFYSKSQPDETKTLEQIRAEMTKYGTQSLNRFNQLHTYFTK